KVPDPRLNRLTVVGRVSVTLVVPEVAVALIKDAAVFVIVAPPVPVFSVSVCVAMEVAGVWLMIPVPVAVKLVVPETLVLPIVEMPEFVPAFNNVKLAAVNVPAAEIV